MTLIFPGQSEVSAYLAGLFDGEGCVSIRARYDRNRVKASDYLRLQVLISNTHVGVLRWVKDQCGGTFHKTGAKKPHHKQAYTWVAVGHAALEFLRRIKPYVIVKDEQVELGIRCLEFMMQGRSKRCHMVVYQESVQGRGFCRRRSVRTPETLNKELEFYTKMKALNQRGTA